jgi:hypothetical protein
MAKKGAKKKAAKKKPAKPKRQARKPVQRKQSVMKADVVIKIGCNGSDCVSDSNGKNMGGPGSKVLLCAPTGDVKLTFSPRSPFVSGTNPLSISKGTCRAEVIAAGAGGSFTYHPTCSKPGCGNLSADPTMIVP